MVRTFQALKNVKKKPLIDKTENLATKQNRFDQKVNRDDYSKTW